MMGLIDEGTAPTPAAAAADQGSDPIAQTRDAVEKKVPQQYQDALQRVVLAGQKILYDQTTNSVVEKQLQAGGNPAEAAGKGVVQLMGVLTQESRGTLPKGVAGPATMVLLTEILDYLKQTGRIKGTSEDLQAATKALSETMMQGIGGAGQNFDQMLDKVSQAMNDPKIASTVQQHIQGA